MEFNATIDLIIRDLNEACQIIDDLKSYPGVPELQVELAKSKCKSAGEVIALLKTIKHQASPVKEEKIQVQPAIKYEEPVKAVTVEPPVESKPFPAPEKKVPQKQQKARQITEQQDIKKEKKPAIETSEPSVTGSAIFADTFTNMPESLNEKLGGIKASDDVRDIIKTIPIKSLKEAIGLNDRFLFLREIFNGDSEAYDQAIKRLEETESAEDAKAVIISYTGTSEENEATTQLMELVKRKLGINE